MKQKRTLTGYAEFLGWAGTTLASRVARLAVSVVVVLGNVAAISAFRGANVFLVQGPAFDATGAARGDASETSRWTGYAFATLLVGTVAGWAGGATGSV